MNIRLLGGLLILWVVWGCTSVPLTPTPSSTQSVVPESVGASPHSEIQLKGLPPVIYVSRVDKRRSLRQLDVVHKTDEVLTPSELDSYAPQLSPDKKQVAFVVQQDGQADIYLQNLETKAIKQLVSHPGNDYYPKWSPDGKKIAFLSDRAGHIHIWMVQPVTGEVIAFSQGNANHFDLEWSSDGRYLAYSSDQSGIPQIVVADLGSQQHRMLAQEKRANFLPKWRPGTHELSYISLLGQAELRLQVLGQSQETTLSSFVTGGQVISYAWSPDGQKIALPHSCAEILCLSVQSYAAKQLKQHAILVSSSASYASPEWSDNSRYLVYTAVSEDSSQLLAYDFETEQETPLTQSGHNYSADWSLSQFTELSEQVSFSSLEVLQAQKMQVLGQLVQPISHCVGQKDTQHAAFSGCIDWHSAVHGTWALTKYTQLTGDRRYVPLIEKQLSAQNVQAEKVFLQANPYFEMPYGRAWFLRLAIDYQQAFQSAKLSALAEDVAASLYQHYQQHPSSPFSTSYNNDSWALLNLYDYAKAQNRQDLLAFVERQFQANYLSAQGCKATAEETIWTDFMPVCTTAAFLASRILTPPELTAWLAQFYLDQENIQPILSPRRTHHFGANFSRAWGLWALYEKTGAPKYLDDYLRHVSTAYFNEKHWKYNYSQISHWVAQFGVFAFASAFFTSG